MWPIVVQRTDLTKSSLDYPACLSSVFCHVYMTADSYLSIKTNTAVEAQELLSITAGRMECAEDGLLLASETCAGGNGPTAVSCEGQRVGE